MTTWYLIPLTSTPQTFGINLNGLDYILTVKWNYMPDAGWEFDLQDSSSNYLLAGAPLITGNDCLAGLGYLGIGGQFIVTTEGNFTQVPTFTNLGDQSNLYFVVQS
jgi:hypothetical protein